MQVDGSYEFAYNVQDGQSNSQFRQEKRTPDGRVTGSYGYVDPNGVQRIVDYVADHNGYRVQERNIQTNQRPPVPGSGPYAPPITDARAINNNIPITAHQNTRLRPLTPLQRPILGIEPTALTNKGFGLVPNVRSIHGNPQQPILGIGPISPSNKGHGLGPNFGLTQTSPQLRALGTGPIANPTQKIVPIPYDGVVQSNQFSRRSNLLQGQFPATSTGFSGRRQLPNRYTGLGNSRLPLSYDFPNPDFSRRPLEAFDTANPVLARDGTFGLEGKSGIFPTDPGRFASAKSTKSVFQQGRSGFEQFDRPLANVPIQPSPRGINPPGFGANSQYGPTNGILRPNEGFNFNVQRPVDRLGSNFPRRKNNIQEAIAGTVPKTTVFQNTVFHDAPNVIDGISDGNFGHRLPDVPKLPNGRSDTKHSVQDSGIREPHGGTRIQRIGIETLNLDDPNYSG